MDLARLVALWEDRTLRVDEVAEQMGCTLNVLYKVAARHGLKRRKAARKKPPGVDDGTEITWRDPTPAEIERMKEELFQARLAKLRVETPEETAERVLRELREVYAG
jgi:transposase-like protein